MIKLIIAIAENNLIGNGNRLPWHIKSELIHFKNTTMGHSLLFGRKTLDSIPANLEGRTLYSFGRTSSNKENAININNEKELDSLFSKFSNNKDILYIAGGKYIYENYYSKADEIILTKIKGSEFKGDIFLKWDLSLYGKKLLNSNEKFDIFSYKLKK